MMQSTAVADRVAWLRAEPGEWAAFGWSFLYFFALLAGYYVLRPVRDALGAVHRLELLFTATFVCMVLLTPVYGALIARFRRRTFLPLVYLFFIACLLGFYVVFDRDLAWRGPVFFVWVAVFNLFAVSVFWSFMSDVFDNAQAKRLYGGIAAGGTCGGLVGPWITAHYAERIGVPNLLLISAALLGLCVAFILALAPIARANEARRGVRGADEAMGGSVLAGARLVLRSRLLQAMSLLMFFGIGVGTLLYREQAEIAKTVAVEAARSAFYGRIDLYINLLTLAVQTLVTRWLLVRYDIGPALLIPGLAILAGFCALAAAPLPLLVAVVQIGTRAGEFSLGKPARESVYTRVDREIRYKAKSFIDTAVYRGADLTHIWMHTGLVALGLGSAGVFGVGIFVAGAMIASALWLIRLARELPSGGGAPDSGARHEVQRSA
jgi:AAA family ATP:ADP antiporter